MDRGGPQSAPESLQLKQTSERQTQSKLHGTRVQGAGDLAEIAGDLRSGLIPLRTGSHAAELRMVEYVVRLHLETEVDPLREPEVLEQREVGVVETRTTAERRRRVAERQPPQNPRHI